MRLSSGIDLIEIARIEAAISRHGRHYLERVYTPAELEQSDRRIESLAGRFAAKEAVAKALGCGLGKVTWKEIEILGDEQNAPRLFLHGEAARLAQEQGLTTWSISVSHSQSHAVAVAIGLSH